MKLLKFTSILILLASSGCATTAKYEAKIRTWEDKDASALTRAWGQPDATEKQSNGNKIFLYARLKHEAVPYGTERTIASAGSTKNTVPAETYIRCATYFEVNPQGKIVSTLFRGEECKSKD